MIKGVHTMFYSSHPEELRAFLRDKLGFSATDVGDGWLIFDLPEAEMGIHPVDKGDRTGPKSGTPYISFYCTSIEQTIHELEQRGVEFTDRVSDVGYGMAIHFKMPGGFEAELYEPRYRIPRDK